VIQLFNILGKTECLDPYKPSAYNLKYLVFLYTKILLYHLEQGNGTTKWASNEKLKHLSSAD
jgi:hypothetical protein